MPFAFPGEQEVKKLLESELSASFEFSRRLLKYWIGAKKDNGFNNSTLHAEILQVAFSMSVRSCRRLRSTIELCERGESVDAAMISRSLYETALAVGFVLKPRFKPREFDKTGKAKKNVTFPTAYPSRQLRAQLFLAYHAFQDESFSDRHANRAGLKQESKKANELSQLAGEASQFKQLIGPKWTERLKKHPFTYSGLSIANLAYCLGDPLPKWYHIIYSDQSEHVHSQDFRSHIQIVQASAVGPRWQDSTDDVLRALRSAITMFLFICGMLNKYLDFGVALNTGLHSFSQEYTELISSD